MNFLAPILSLILLYKYWAIFVVMYVAALILPLPTNSVLLAAGAFASQGYFNFPITLVVAVVANILGDVTGYILARKYGKRALKILHIKTPASLARLEDLVRQHPGPTIFITRFFGTADSLANILCGYIEIPLLAFLAFDFLGNTVSTGGVMYVGYFFGVNWQKLSAPFDIVGWAALAVILIAVVVWLFWRRKHPRKSEKAINKGIDAVLNE